MKLCLKKNEEGRIKAGHLWVFSNETAEPDAGISNGDVVEVLDSSGNPLGSGFYNRNSLIALRLLGHDYKGDLADYFASSIRKAYNLRKQFYPHRSSFRLAYSESDFLPGLIIDKYNNTFVLQVYCYGMQKNIGHVVDVLRNEFEAENIFSRNEPYFRKLEGLQENDEVYLGAIKDEIIDDGDLKYKIDFANSQKTGFYFDQCDNRKFIERFARDKSVLDAFCNSGGFGMHASFKGASHVTFVDSSKQEIINAKYNYELNNLEPEAKFIESDVFDFLQNCISGSIKYDIVMLDPPAFAKSRKSIPSAIKGYTKLNKLALQVVSENGFLVTSSCSHHIKQNDFIEAVNIASVKAGKSVQLLHLAGASSDHPRIPAMEETSYLKFAVLRVI